MWNKINKIIKNSMRNKDVETLAFARNLKTKINEYLVAEKLSRNDVDDEVVIKVAKSYQKSLNKAIEELKGDLVEEYGREVGFCNQFVPAGPSKEEIKALVLEAVDKVGKNNFGKLMGYVMKNNRGLDGAIVREIINEF